MLRYPATTSLCHQSPVLFLLSQNVKVQDFSINRKNCFKGMAYHLLILTLLIPGYFQGHFTKKWPACPGLSEHNYVSHPRQKTTKTH